MSNRVWVDPRFPLVRVAGVRSYLLSWGWRPRPYPRPELLVFERPADDDGQPIVQVLPSSEQMRDFPSYRGADHLPKHPGGPPCA